MMKQCKKEHSYAAMLTMKQWSNEACGYLALMRHLITQRTAVAPFETYSGSATCKQKLEKKKKKKMKADNSSISRKAMAHVSLTYKKNSSLCPLL